MLEVTVKTLDSQNHSFSVPEESTVREFKEQISPVLNISVDKQRLIFCGKVLKDDKKLNEYDVNGKVIHVVQSLPPQGSNASSSSSSTTSAGLSSTTSSGPRVSHRDAAGFVLGAFTIPQDFMDANQMQNIVQEVVSGMGDLGRNATVISRTTEDGPSVDLRINLGQVPLQSEAQLRMNRVQTMFMRANRLLDSLEEGNGSGNNSSESSSQTDNDEEFRNRLMEAEIGNVIRGDSNVNSSASGDSSMNNETQNESMNTSSPSGAGESRSAPPVPERYPFEGLAQVAQAALTAAIATATAAARAATSSLSPQETRTSEGAETRNNTVDTEPVDTSENATPDLLAFETSPPASSDSTPVAMDVEPSTTSNGETVQPTAAEERKAESTSDGTSNTAQSSSADSAGSGPAPTSRETSQPSVQTLANLLDEVIRVNTRLEPCLEKCRDLIRNDAALSGPQLIEAHRLFSKTSQLLHFLSHAYHSLSDLHINFAARPPRSPRVRIISSSPTVFQQAIPLQAQINISSSVIPSSSSSSTTSSSNSTTTTTTTNSQSAASETRSGAPNPPRSGNLPRSGSLPRVSSTSSIPSMMRSQNPMFFMEVTPGSITIDSISSAMDASVSAIHSAAIAAMHSPDDDSDASSRDTPTPPAPTSNQAETRSETQTSDIPTSTTRTTSIPIPPFAGQGPTMMPAVRHLIPVPLTSMGSLQTFDSALPCHSVWALEPSRRRHNAGGSRTGANTQRNNQSATDGVQPSSQTAPMIPTPNAPGRQDEQISGLVNTLVASLSQPNPINQALTMLTNVALRENRSARADSTEQGNRDRQQRPNSAPRFTTFAPCPLSISPAVNDQMFHDLVQGLRSSSMLPSGTRTLVELFFGNRNVQFPENDIVGNVFHFICSQMNTNDLLEASLGNFQPLNRLREPWLHYVRERIFPPGNSDEQNSAVVEQIVSNFDDITEPFSRDLPVQPNINYRETMKNFFRHAVNILQNAFQDPIPDGGQFGNYLKTILTPLLLEFLYLQSVCIDNGLHNLQQSANRIIADVCSGGNSSFRLALLCMVSRLVSRDSSSVVEDETARRHMVYKTPDSSKDNSTKKSESDGRATSASARFRNADLNERVMPENIADSFRTTERETPPALSALARIVGQSSLRNSGRNNENRSPASSLTEVVIGSDAWHSTLPRDWVPIIARDVQRQRRQAPQSPFSNAYLSGMPSKRRKIMTNGSPVLLNHSQATLSDMLQQAITNANVKPLSSSEEVKRDASQDLPLQAAFTLHMKNVIQERLQRDLDYCSEKFPNAKKYYNIDQL